MTVREAASRTTRKRLVAAARDLRALQTRSERLLWDSLRNRRLLGRKFRRQARIGHFVVDFYCPEERLVLEVDGAIHHRRRTADRDRQAVLEAKGLRVLRVTAEACEQRLDEVLDQIRSALSS
ncbi:MAG: endonuclease domain-containing protein, partial [Dehalococcoidia bacterium]|nr:endonuclease domain-containing protein [Dehalococcoidia bacterium]